MNQSDNIQLYTKLFRHIIRLHDDLEYRINQNGYIDGSRRKRKQYPAVSVGSELATAMAIGDHHCHSKQSDFHDEIYSSLIHKLGDLNKVESLANNGCINKVGHCAENYAASEVLRGLEGTDDFPTEIRELLFTLAICPRTWTVIDWCGNCHSMYD